MNLTSNRMKKRIICVVITARPSYSRIKTALVEIEKHPNLDLKIIVAASALLSRYGNASEIIEKDGFKIYQKIYNILEGESITTAAKSTGLGIIEISSVFNELKPDIVVTIADRFETIATAIAASYMNIPLAHIQGGEVTGNIDEKVRHSITKLADYHFVTSKDAYNRVAKLGEDEAFIFDTGCPSIDLAKKVKNSDIDLSKLLRMYSGVGFDVDVKKNYLVVMQHPVTTEYQEAFEQINKTLEAIKALNIPTLWFWPNVDAGSDSTSKALRIFRERHRDMSIKFIKNMEPEHFLHFLKNAMCLIGNSSVGIRECEYLGVPVINIGSRQNKRLRGSNVLDVEYNTKAIIESFISFEGTKFKTNHLYGAGDAGKKIADILSKVPLRFHKTITY